MQLIPKEYFKLCTPANCRNFFTALQTSLLTELYERNHYPSFAEMKRLSIILGVDVQKVASWIKFKRCNESQGKSSGICYMYMYKWWKVVFNKNRVIRTATKRTETSVWHPTQSTLLCKRTKWIRDVSALRWRSYTCLCPFCGSPNFPFIVKKTLSLLDCTLLYMRKFYCTRITHYAG